MNKQFIACLLIGLTVSGFTRPQEDKETLVSRVNYFSTQAVHLIVE